MTRFALAMAAAFVLPAACTPAFATPVQPPSLCAPLRAHVQYLSKRWGEWPFAPGRIGRDVTVILFLNPATRSWTLIRITDGVTGCAIGAGKLPAAPASPPAPSDRAKPSVF